jgi:acyl-CoA reductase-like NAD-dependent aldehyde dehydrogenase
MEASQTPVLQLPCVLNPAGGTSHQTLFHPAIVYPMTAQIRLYREEQFGPVIPIVPFTDLKTPIGYVAESNPATIGAGSLGVQQQ